MKHRGERPEEATGRRLFIAIPIPERVTKGVAAVVAEIRAAGDPAVRDVRWVRLDGLHLTIRFLGPTADERVDAVVAAVDEAAGATAPFEVVIAGAGAFPTPARPRALWLGVPTGRAELASVAGRLDEALVPAGWPPSDRPFEPHLTLARSDGVRAGPAIARRLMEAGDRLREPFRAESLTLFESITGGGPARYVAIHTAAFR